MDAMTGWLIGISFACVLNMLSEPEKRNVERNASIMIGAYLGSFLALVLGVWNP